MNMLKLSVCVALVGSMVVGCASIEPVAQIDSRVSQLEIRFENAQAEEKMSKLGLTKSYSAYWQAHKGRNWASRFLMEDLKSNLTEKFYAAYYDKAWSLQSVTVSEVKGDAEAATVSMAYSFVNPETSKVMTYSTVDGWVWVGGTWMHVVSDPMLSGIKQ